MQALAQAIEAVGSVDQAKLADYLHKNTIKTLAGDINFSADGEWSQHRVIFVQFQGLKSNDVDQFRQVGTQVVLTPAQYRSGKFIYPLADAKK
jgi:branched-chain amino acid transport system substrate-binding protein